jgi:hypothetical protein
MKKLLFSLLLLGLLIPSIVSSDFSTTWQATSTAGYVFPSKLAGTYPQILIPFLTSTTTATSTFAGAVKSTCFTVTGLTCLSSGSGITGPSSSTNNGIPIFDGTTGQVVKRSGIKITSSGGLSFLEADISSSDNPDGYIDITADTSALGVGGNAGMYAADSSSGNTNGGEIEIFSGAGFGSGQGGVVGIFAGQGGSTGDGGGIDLSAGAGGATSGFGGDISLYGGSAQGGNSGGGDIYLQPGFGKGNGSRGSVNLHGTSSAYAKLDTSRINTTTKSFFFPNTTGGLVINVGSSTDNAIARFDSTTGQILQNSSTTISDNGTLNLGAGLSDSTTATGTAGMFLKSTGTSTIWTTTPVTQKRRTLAYTLTNTFVSVPMDVTDVQSDSSRVIASTTASTTITVIETGLYEIHYHGDIAQGTSANDGSVQVVKNAAATLIPGSELSMKNSSTDKVAVSATFYANLTAGEFLQPQARYPASSGGLLNNFVFWVKKI